MPEYRYVGDDIRDFPTLGVYEIEPGETFITDRPVASVLVVTADGEPTHVDGAGNPIGDPTNNVGLGVPVEASPAEEAEALARRPLEEWTKDELLELAKDMDVPGRSTMTKDELLTVLHDAVEAPVTTTDEAAGGADTDPEE